VFNPEYTMLPLYIFADATPGVVYDKGLYTKNDDLYSGLWVSFDYGKNWIWREENIGSRGYFAANVEGVVYRHGTDGAYKSEDYGETFSTIDIVSAGHEPGLLNGEAFSVGTTNSYQGRLAHTYDFYNTYTTIKIDSQYVFDQIDGIFPDVYRGGKSGEVYVSSWFPDGSYKVSFSADTGHTYGLVGATSR
jgi:hypothetical protein